MSAQTDATNSSPSPAHVWPSWSGWAGITVTELGRIADRLGVSWGKLFALLEDVHGPATGEGDRA